MTHPYKRSFLLLIFLLFASNSYECFAGENKNLNNTVLNDKAYLTPPVANATTGLSQSNPGGNIKITVPTLTGYDAEDGIYNGISVTNKIKIASLPVSGVLYYSNVPVVLNEVILNYDPSKLAVDPNNGITSVTFNFIEIDADGMESAPALVKMPFTNSLPTTADKLNASIKSNQVTPVDLSDFTGVDVDGTITGYIIQALPTKGTLYLGDGTTAVILNQILTQAEANALKFRPVGNSNATVTFKFAAIDNEGAEDQSPATFTIPLSNTPPVAVADAVTTLEDNSVTLVAIQNNDTDSDGTIITSTIDLDPVTAGQQITFTDNKGTWKLTPATGNVLFTPVLNYNGSASINYTISDNDGATSNPATLTVTITPVNDDPVAKPDVKTFLENSGLNFVPASDGLLSNDYDVDGDYIYVFKYTVADMPGEQIIGDDVIIPNVGTINIGITGKFAFTPLSGFVGQVPLITYYIVDPIGSFPASSTLTITVIDVNDAPSFTKGLDQVTFIDAPLQTVVNWATDLSKGPANESAQTLDFIVSNDKNFLFDVQPSVSANGTLTYKPALGKYGKSTVTVRIHDDGGTAFGGKDTSLPQTFTISIKPVGVDDVEYTLINIPVTTIVTSNDGLSGVGTTVVNGGTNPTNGTIVINTDNSITYTPNADYVGPDRYTYILRTPDGVDSDPITVSLIVYKAEISLTKDGSYFDFNGDGKVNVGDRVNYSFKLKNVGTVSVTTITITDPKATLSISSVASLAGGSELSFTGYYTLAQADIDNGGTYNLAVANGKDPKNNSVTGTSKDPTPLNATDYLVNPPIPVCPTCTITPIIQTSALALAKVGIYNDFNGDGEVNVGDRINYTFTVTNVGNVTITNISITDNNAVVSGSPLASLSPGASNSTAFVGYHVLTQTDIDNGGVFNLATVNGKDPKGNDVTVTSIDPNPLSPSDPNYPVNTPTTPCPTCTVTPIVQISKISLLKDGAYIDYNADGKINAGDRINYTFVLKNVGNVTLSNVAITDPNAVITGSPIATLSPGAQNTTAYTGYHIISQADIENGGVFNLATAKATNTKNKEVITISKDPTPLSPTDVTYPIHAPTPACPTCTVTPLTQVSSFTLTKDGAYVDTNGDGKVNVGDRINYVFVFLNTGNVTLTNLKVTDNNAVVNAVTLASLAPGASDNSTFTAFHILTQADIDNRGVFNLATATATDPRNNNFSITSTDPTPLSPTSPVYPINAPVPICGTCTVTPIVQTVSIALVKLVTNTGTGKNGGFVKGDNIQYTFTITNTGNVTLNNLTITDAKLGLGTISIAGVLLPNATTSLVRTYSITAADVATGNVTNSAKISANSLVGVAINDLSGSTQTNDIPTVTPLLVPPKAVDDVITITQNSNIKIAIQNNDVAGSAPIVVISVVITNQPLSGTLTINADGTVTYTPNKGYFGNDDFKYTITDTNNLVSNIALVSINVAKTAPKAIDDNAQVEYNKNVSVPIIANDIKDVAEFDLSTIQIIAQPLHGILKVNADGTVLYTPNKNYTGEDFFTYRIKDTYGNFTNVAKVIITVDGLFFANAITPNGDGKNDYWVIVGTGNYDKVEVEIFNPLGNQVYKNDNYKNDWNADRLNNGTYFYTVRLIKGNVITTKKGWVLVKR